MIQRKMDLIDLLSKMIRKNGRKKIVKAFKDLVIGSKIFWNLILRLKIRIFIRWNRNYLIGLYSILAWRINLNRFGK